MSDDIREWIKERADEHNRTQAQAREENEKLVESREELLKSGSKDLWNQFVHELENGVKELQRIYPDRQISFDRDARQFTIDKLSPTESCVQIHCHFRERSFALLVDDHLLRGRTEDIHEEVFNILVTEGERLIFSRGGLKPKRYTPEELTRRLMFVIINRC